VNRPSEIAIRWYRRKMLSQWGLLESYAHVSDAVFRFGVVAFLATAATARPAAA
jgi:hypothetical protein